MIQVVLMEDYLDHAKSLASVKELASKTKLTIYTDRASSEDELIARLGQAEIVITIRDRVMFTSDVLARASHLKLLSVCGPRLRPHVDLDAATREGILVCKPQATNVTQTIHHATAELVWSLILGLVKKTVQNHSAMQQGAWQTGLGSGLYGKTMGVIGLGRVGLPVAQIGNAMGMRVLAWSPNLNAQKAAAVGVQAVSFDQLLSQSDVISLNANLTDKSRCMINQQAIAKMKYGVYLVNTARGDIVDETALQQALDSGHVAGAGLDVFWQEPLPVQSWVRNHPCVLMQPHMGGFTNEGYEWLIEPAVNNVLAYLNGDPKEMANPQVFGR